jgi:hypothetical protein
MGVVPDESSVECFGELSAAVVDEEAHRFEVLAECHGQVPGLLGGPRSVRVRGDAGDVDAAGAVFDEHQHVEAS